MPPLSNEDRYFLELEAQQRAKWRAEIEARAQAAAEHRAIADKMGLADEQLAQRIRALGFDGETARVLHLMPLLEVAWADGRLSDQERRVILRAAEAHGITPGTQAGVFLASLLEQRPSNTVLDEVLLVLKELLHAKSMRAATVLDACLEVAEASGGFLGLGTRISAQERAVIEEIAASFGAEAKNDLVRRLG